VNERGLEPGGDVDVRAQSDRQRVARTQRVGVVVRELQPGDDEEVVEIPRPQRFGADGAEICVVVCSVDLARIARRVVGDR